MREKSRCLDGDIAQDKLADLLQEVVELREQVVRDAELRLSRFTSLYPRGRPSTSAENLAQYLSLRAHDLRTLQCRLTQFGLSSLGRGEPHILVNLDRVINMLCRAVGVEPRCPDVDIIDCELTPGDAILEKNTERLFGPAPESRKVRIMVTLPSEAAWNYPFVQSLIEVGTDCVRINCAHDNPLIWERMIENVRKAAVSQQRSCKILMDLAGPKIRTGPLEAEPPVLHVKPRRDNYGRITAPAKVVIRCALRNGSDEICAADNHYQVTLPKEFFNRLSLNDRLTFADARNKRRTLHIVDQTSSGDWLATCAKGAYLSGETTFDLQPADGASGNVAREKLPLIPFSGQPCEIRLHVGDALLLTPDLTPGGPAIFNDNGGLARPARIGCTLPQALKRLSPGHSVWIDDGKIGALVESITEEGVLLRVTHAGPKGVRLRAEKGLNFPDTDLNLFSLSEKDLLDLEFICRYADIIGFSFVETLTDLERLMDALAAQGAPHLPIVAKIETDRAVRNLPELILGAIGRCSLGVMIARGDLSVELGSVRLAEIQEEMLWLCEAAHVPVIWATQVLETLTKKGTRSRPEFTDAAMGVRAECVMLNKGPYVRHAVRALNNVMVRMQDHQRKKSARLRALSWGVTP